MPDKNKKLAEVQECFKLSKQLVAGNIELTISPEHKCGFDPVIIILDPSQWDVLRCAFVLKDFPASTTRLADIVYLV